MRIFLNILFLLTVHTLFSQKLIAVDGDSKVKFRIKNLGFTTEGSFKGIRGTIVFDLSAPAKGSFDVTVDANTIDTDNKTRDNHLRKEDYFDVKTYPAIHFVSTGITAGQKAGTLIVNGKLTIKKTTKEISFPFTAKNAGNGIRFIGEFKINRRDFDVGGGSTVSDNLIVCLDVLTRKA